MARIPMREPSEVIDSEEASSELGTGSGEAESAKPSSDKKPEADGSTEQFA
jgi:cell division protease FtsH